ncbi:hypothetical protein RMATCC62417_04706 [Rhizopus microsporus]|nr:hypothetical protein RMATCC62417_04706 [Rhizopus microsporus]
MSVSDPLDPSAVLQLTSQIITRLESPYDALAAAMHAIMLSVGFRFAGLGDDARQEGDGTQRNLPAEWNQHGPHYYHFRYSHPQSSLTFVIKVVRMGDKCVILGIGIGDNKTVVLDIATDDYTSASFFPNDLSNDPIVHGFISSNRFHDFIKTVKLNIIQRLIPGLNKPGYDDSTTTTTTTTSSSGTIPSRNQPRQPPFMVPPPMPTDPYNVGGDDLNPFGDRLRLPGSRGTGGGMYVGPNHPIFGGRFDDPPIGGGPENLPRGAVPPGARFDPITPPGPRFNPRNFRAPRSGEPDNDELLPPVSD